MGINLNSENYIRGRGAQINPNNSFFKNSNDQFFEDYKLAEEQSELILSNSKTEYLPVHPKSILNKNPNKEVEGYSMNPYQGCEHGCAYCYARNSHEYWGYSAGLDFEQKIMYKKESALLLKKAILHKNYKPMTILLSGNTDCYQPIERKMNLTRQCLEVLAQYKHPTSIITKNCLIERDIDIFQEMSKNNLINLNISLNTTNEKLKQILEPRTSSVKHILRTIQLFASHNIPIYVLAMPIIPAINDDTIPELIKMTSEAGAWNIHYQPVKISKNLELVFFDWVERNFPDRKEKVLHRLNEIYHSNISAKHKDKDSIWLNTLKQQFSIYKKKYYPNPKEYKTNFSHFLRWKDPQLKLDFGD